MNAFPNLTKAQVETFVIGLFDISGPEPFKQHLRDFLVNIKEFAEENNSDMYMEEQEAAAAETEKRRWEYQQSVPGLLKPDELDELGEMWA